MSPFITHEGGFEYVAQSLYQDYLQLLLREKITFIELDCLLTLIQFHCWTSRSKMPTANVVSKRLLWTFGAKTAIVFCKSKSFTAFCCIVDKVFGRNQLFSFFSQLTTITVVVKSICAFFLMKYVNRNVNPIITRPTIKIITQKNKKKTPKGVLVKRSLIHLQGERTSHFSLDSHFRTHVILLARLVPY